MADLMSVVTEYMIPVVVIICLVVGFIIKNYVTVIPNHFIPIIVTVLGALLAIWVNMSVSPEVLAQGLVSGLASTGLHQVLTRTLEKMGADADSTTNSTDNDNNDSTPPTAVG